MAHNVREQTTRSRRKSSSRKPPVTFFLNSHSAQILLELATPLDLSAPFCCFLCSCGLSTAPFCAALRDLVPSECKTVIQYIKLLSNDWCGLRCLRSGSQARLGLLAQLNVHTSQVAPAQVARSSQALKVAETDTDRTSGGRTQVATNVSLGADNTEEGAKTVIIISSTFTKYSRVGTQQFFQRDTAFLVGFVHHVAAVFFEPSVKVLPDLRQNHVVLDDCFQMVAVSSFDTQTVDTCGCTIILHAFVRTRVDASDAASPTTAATTSGSVCSSLSHCRHGRRRRCLLLLTQCNLRCDAMSQCCSQLAALDIYKCTPACTSHGKADQHTNGRE